MDRRRGREALPRRCGRSDRRRVGHGMVALADRRGDRQLSNAIQFSPRTMSTTEGGATRTKLRAPYLTDHDSACILPGVGRERGRRDGHEAGARVPPGPRRRRFGRRSSPGGPPTTATRSGRWTPAGRSRCASRTPPGSAASCTRPRPTSTAAGTRGILRGCGAWHAGELERMILQAGPETVAAFIARAGRRGDARRPLPTDDTGRRSSRSPAERHPGDRRRGHDRLRAHRPLVRRRSLACGRTS